MNPLSINKDDYGFYDSQEEDDFYGGTKSVPAVGNLTNLEIYFLV